MLNGDTMKKIYNRVALTELVLLGCKLDEEEEVKRITDAGMVYFKYEMVR